MNSKDEQLTTNTVGLDIIPNAQASSKVVLKHCKSKKKNRRNLLRMKTTNPILKTIGKIKTRKVLRSVRRRKLLQPQCVTSSDIDSDNAGKDISKDIIMANVATLTLDDDDELCDKHDVKAIIHAKKKHNSSNKISLETNNIDDDDDDDDCVFIEPSVESITIEDESEVSVVSFPCCNTKSSSFPTTSTPYGKSKTLPPSVEDEKLTEESPKQQPNEIVAEKPLFYIDSVRGNCFDLDIWDDIPADNTKLPEIRPPEYEERESDNTDKNNEEEVQQIGGQDDDAISTITSPDDVIVVEESTLVEQDASSQKTSSEDKVSEEIDDSVVFVCELKSPDFIPLQSSNSKSKATVTRRPQTSLFTRSELKQLMAYNVNTYNPCANKTILRSGKRMIIIDGSNVAYSHGLNKEFSVRGLKICLEYFEKMGHEVKAVVPQYRLCKYKSTNPDDLNVLHGAGKVIFTPCKNLPSARTASYDDRFILQLACELDAAIVSNDNYLDLIHENLAFKKIIEQRVVGYTWCNDIFILPKDPYGKYGPPLHTILNRS